jgi:flagellin
MNTDFNIGAMGNVALNRATASKQDSIASLASGKKQNLSRKDPGAFSLSQRLQVQSVSNQGAKVAIQNAMSIAHTQEEALNRMSKLLTKMNELAGMASSTGTLSADRDAYQAAFAGFVDDFEKIQSEKFNGVNVFGNTMGDEEKQLLDSLKDHWLAATEKLVQDEYGWTADSSDSWDLVIEENGAVGGSAAFIRSSWTPASDPTDPSSWSNNDYASQATLFSIDLPDLTAPHTVGNSTADTLIAHEMVHLLQAQNTYMGDQAGGDPSRDMTWLAEGLAEFIRGADNRASASKTSLGTTALVQLPGNGWNGGSDDYAGAYLAVKYLDNQIRSSGAAAVNGVNATDGVKHLTTWMKAQRDANAGASASGLNQYIETHLNGTHGYGVGNATDTSGQAIDDFLADFESANGQAFVNGLNLTDTDTGSVHGSEYGGAVKSTADVVRDDAAYLTGFNSQLTYEEEEVEDPVPIELSGGTAITLSAVNPVSFGDTSTYNLETENGAKLVMERVDELLAIITNSLSQVGSNMGMIERGAQMINSRDSAMVSAISRVSDVSMPEEALNLARSEILINSNINMRVQARNIQQDVMLTMLG